MTRVARARSSFLAEKRSAGLVIALVAAVPAIGTGCGPGAEGGIADASVSQVLVDRSTARQGLPACVEPAPDERYDIVNRVFRLERGIPIEVAFAILSQETRLKHCEGGVVYLNRGTGDTTDGGAGMCQMTPAGGSTLQQIRDWAAEQTDFETHVRHCAGLLDSKWAWFNRAGCNSAMRNSCVERELLEEWIGPIGLFGPSGPGVRSRYIHNVLGHAAQPLDARVPAVTITNPEDCIPGFQIERDAKGNLNGYRTSDMRAGGCKLHVAEGGRNFVTFAGIELKITSGWGAGARSGPHAAARAVDVGVATGSVREHGIPLLCPLPSGCEVVAGGFGQGTPWQWLRFRRADGYPSFTGSGGQEVLHVVAVNDGQSCRGVVPGGTWIGPPFQVPHLGVMGYTANSGEPGYGPPAAGAGPHGHLARCPLDGDFLSSTSCNGSLEPFALDLADGALSSDSLSQAALGGGEVAGLAAPNAGQGALPADYATLADSCCAPACATGVCHGLVDGTFCADNGPKGYLGDASDLLTCRGGALVSFVPCPDGCDRRPPGKPDQCLVPGDPCIGKVCGECQVCSGGACVPAADGVACASDGDSCTVDSCRGGACAHDRVPNDCAGRTCGNSPSGCSQCGSCQAPRSCSGGQCVDPCNGKVCPECQTCSGGACVPVGDGAGCASDGDSCTTDSCQGGACRHTPTGLACGAHGRCLGGGCQCDTGWTGADCSRCAAGYLECGGACVRPACNDGEQRCAGGDVERCDGCSWYFAQPCGATCDIAAGGCCGASGDPCCTGRSCGPGLVCLNASVTCAPDQTPTQVVRRFVNLCNSAHWSSTLSPCYPGTGPTSGDAICQKKVTNSGCAEPTPWQREGSFTTYAQAPGYGSFARLDHCFDGTTNSYALGFCGAPGLPADLGWIATAPTGAFRTPLYLCAWRNEQFLTLLRNECVIHNAPVIGDPLGYVAP